METRKMKVVPEPAPKTRTVLRSANAKDPVITGVGSVTYECGQCRTILLKTIEPGMVSGSLVRCHGCEAYNDFADN